MDGGKKQESLLLDVVLPAKYVSILLIGFVPDV